MTFVYYNENDPYAAEWLRNLIKKGLLPYGYVDERSIKDVDPDTLGGFSQYHFFAGIGGWAYAAQLARWPDDLLLVTGSCPCQPFSVAGKGRGTDDERHLWPDFNRLIRSIGAPVVMGEQVSGKAGHAWFDGVASDPEGQGYATGAVDIPACSVNAPHRRNRLYWVAHTNDARSQRWVPWGQDPQWEAVERHLGRDGTAHGDGDVAHTDGGGSSAERGDAGEVRGLPAAERGTEDGAAVSRGSGEEHGGLAHADSVGLDGVSETWVHDQGPFGNNLAGRGRHDHWGNALWAVGSDGKARRVEPSIQLLAHGVPARVGKLRAFGNAIVPQVAAEVMTAFLESMQ